MPDLSNSCARVAIIGAGLSGLYAAYLLSAQGIQDYWLLEARDSPGGRIASASLETTAKPVAATGCFDLGATWFWPDIQPELDRLVRALQLHRFAQHETGDLLIERSAMSAPQRMRAFQVVPTSMRLAGGMRALIDALCVGVNLQRIARGQIVRRLRRCNAHIEIDSEDAMGGVTTWHAERVLLALPPRLAMRHIAFEPDLPQALASQWITTPTWMAPHAKYLARYDTAFWRHQGLSGEARSALGPLGEIHDASVPGAGAALFGFFALPARQRRGIREDELRASCREQLARLFGPAAAAPQVDVVKDWARDPFTATEADLDESGEHASAPPITPVTGPWQGRLWGIASECSPQFPGYVAGAIEAAQTGVRELIRSSTP